MSGAKSQGRLHPESLEVELSSYIAFLHGPLRSAQASTKATTKDSQIDPGRIFLLRSRVPPWSPEKEVRAGPANEGVGARPAEEPILP